MRVFYWNIYIVSSCDVNNKKFIKCVITVYLLLKSFTINNIFQNNNYKVEKDGSQVHRKENSIKAGASQVLSSYKHGLDAISFHWSWYSAASA